MGFAVATSVIYDLKIILTTTSLLQHQDDVSAAVIKNEEFKDFDEVDDARCAIDENEKAPFDDIVDRVQKSNLDHASKDLLRRLLETIPQHRLKSLLALERIAFFHKYNLDDVRHMKVR